MQLIPALDGKMMVCSEQEIGYEKGDLHLIMPLLPSSNSLDSDLTESSTGPRQLMYRDLSHVLPPFEELGDAGFVPSAFRDELILERNPFPSLPADTLVAQANFVEGGCILAINFYHSCLDGIGAMVALEV